MKNKFVSKLNKLENIIDRNISQILITLFIAIVLLYVYPEIIVDLYITNFVRAFITGAFTFFCIDKMQKSEKVDGYLISKCILFFFVAVFLMNYFNNAILNIIAYIIMIVSIYYIVNEIVENRKEFLKSKSTIVEFISLIIAFIALVFQILEYFIK